MEVIMGKKRITKKTIKKIKENSDWFDTHVEVTGMGRGTANKKAQAIIKEQVIKSLLKDI
jgi:hypothetical protein